MRRYHVTTFGCQMNAHDSERIKGLLEELGLGEAAAPDEADVLVLNTCTIREKPDTRFAAHMGNAAKLKRERPGTVIAVGGCLAEAQRERLFELYPDVDVAFGPGTISHLGDWLGAGGEGVARGAFGTGEERAFAARLPVRRERRFQAWVQGSMGCNSICSYCILPALRGRETSPRPRQGPPGGGPARLGPPSDASGASRPGCRSRWAATRSAPTASSPPSAGARPPGAPARSSRRSGGSPPRAFAR